MSAPRSAVALVLGILLLAHPVLPASGSPAPAGPTALAAADPAGPVPDSDYVVPRGADGRAYVRTWPGRRIRYHESIPKKWDWSLSRAVDAWNDSGSKIKFVEVSSRSRAQLTISYGDTGGSDGMATVGQTQGAWVRLSPRYRQAGTDPHTRVWVGRLFAHELGHVVGFGHTSGSCSLMVPVFDMGRCALLAPDPGYYVCRWIDRPLLTRFIRMYGGTAHRPPARCLIDPLPPQLTDVTFEGGQTEDRAVAIRWRAPAEFPTGTRVHVRVWPGTQCGTAPGSADLYSREVDQLSWTDPSVRDGTFCYQAQIVNRLGAGRPAFARAMEGWWPPPDPG